jgi:hypothetical protein
MIEQLLTENWNIIVSVLIVVIWLNRTTARLEQRVINLEQKMIAIWERYNSLIDKLMANKEK